MRQRVVRRIVWAIICTNPPIYLNDVTSVTLFPSSFFPSTCTSFQCNSNLDEIYRNLLNFFPFLSRLIGIKFYQFFLSYTFDAAHYSLFLWLSECVSKLLCSFSLWHFMNVEENNPKIYSLFRCLFHPIDLYIYTECFVWFRAAFFPMLWRFVVMYQSIYLSFGFNIRKY